MANRVVASIRNGQKYCLKRYIVQANEFIFKPVAREAESKMNASTIMGNRSGHPLLRWQALEYIHFASHERTSSKTGALH